MSIAFVIVTAFFPQTRAIEIADAVFGILIRSDFVMRFVVAPRKGQYFLRFTTLADVVAMISFPAPLAGEGFGFLRVLRRLRFSHTYHLTARLREDFRCFRDHQDVMLATDNPSVFLFVMTGLVFALDHETNPEITNCADALCFTVTTLTATGFGDITLEGTSGRLLSVVVMIVAIPLFLRLATALFRPPKVYCTCESCGLKLHDPDAMHCKPCGAMVKIETEGLYRGAVARAPLREAGRVTPRLHASLFTPPCVAGRASGC